MLNNIFQARKRRRIGECRSQTPQARHIASATVYALKIAAFEPKSILTEASFLFYSHLPDILAHMAI